MSVPGEDPIGRNEVAEVLRQAAAAMGESPDMLSTHSLRAGGATALYAAGYGEAEITYHGRWASASWLVYVHRTVARSGDVARRVFDQKVSLLRLPVDAGGRLGRDSSGSLGGRRGAPQRKKQPPPKAGSRNVAPINRATSSMSSEASPAHSTGPSVCVTPAKRESASQPRRAPGQHLCSLQNLFGYGSPG